MLVYVIYMHLLFIFVAKYLVFLAVMLAIIGFIQLDIKQKKTIFIVAVISLPIIFLLSRLIGSIYFNPRPFVIGNFIPLIPHAPDNGFPSDHALLLSALAMLFWQLKQRLSYVLLMITILVGIARVYSGVHHTIDILGGLILSIVVVNVVRHLATSHFNQSHRMRTS